MSETSKRPRTTQNPVKRVRVVSVYQPAVPIRSVCVWPNDDDDIGDVFIQEEVVLGIQVSVAETYVGPVVSQDRRPQYPVTLSPRHVEAVGYRMDHACPDEVIEHSVIVWSADYDCPLPISDTLIECSHRIVGPKDMPPGWWDERIAQATAAIKAKRATTPPLASPV